MKRIMSNSLPAIVVIACDRALSLRRLLRSLSRVRFKAYPDLVISIDGAGNREVLATAEEFDWPGKKRIIAHSKRLGLKSHIMSCADLSQDYGATILLEDDLVTAPGLYEYALAALDFFWNSPVVAGISLHSYSYNESAGLPFTTLAPGNGNYFAQLPSSWGQLWTAEQWQLFRAWMDKGVEFDDRHLPPNVRAWPESSWKKEFLRYMIDRDRYFVYPGTSFTANCGEAGANVTAKSPKWVPPMTPHPMSFAFCPFEKSALLYDPCLEIMPAILQAANSRLRKYDFQVDLYGVKYGELDSDALVLTTLPAAAKMESFGLELKPPELNVMLDIEGAGMHLCQAKDISTQQISPAILHYYYPVDEWNLPALTPPLREQIRSRLDYSVKRLTTHKKRGK